jgi:hypothetical protein
VLAEPEPDPHDLSLLETTLNMTVEDRLRRLENYVRLSKPDVRPEADTMPDFRPEVPVLRALRDRLRRGKP